MGSVLTETDCPRCGQYATEDYYYKTGESYIFCANCGYRFSETIERDENGLFKKDEEGHYNYIVKEEKPYASYRLSMITGGVSLGILEDEDALEKLKDLAKKARSKGIESIIVSRFDGNKIITNELEIPVGKRVISPEDPFGEEDWD